MREQLEFDILSPDHRRALEKEHHELTQLTRLFTVYFPPDKYCRPESKVEGKTPIPQAKWDVAHARAERARTIREILQEG